MNQTPKPGHWMWGDLKAYVDGEMPMWRQRVAAWHLQRCASCRSEADWLKRMRGNFAEWENDPGTLPRPELRARILACLPTESPLQLAQKESVLKSHVSYSPALRPTLALGSLVAIALLVGGAFAMRLHSPAHALAKTPALTNSATTATNTTNPPPVSEVEKPYRVVRIFKAPKNSFDEARTVATNAAGSAHSSVTPSPVSETNAMREEPPGVTGSASPVPSDEVYTDPTSREAERRASLAIGKLLTARHQQMLAGPKHAPAPATRPTPAVASQVALAVADVSEARQQLQQWATTSGAKMRVMVEKGNLPAVVSANGTPLPAGILVEMRVPARIADSLQTHLSQLGTPLPQIGANMKTPRALTMQESSSVAGQAPVLPPPSNAIASTANGSNFVTVRVRLLPGDTLVQP